MGGLTAALQLRRHGFSVRVLEARPVTGGLAGSNEHEGFRFDAGPYILLDRPGLEWVFAELGLNLADLVPLRRIDAVYEVGDADGAVVRIASDLEETAAGLERAWPGSGSRYRQLVTGLCHRYQRLGPLQRCSRPSVFDLLRTGAWREVPFLLRSLETVLAGACLPPPVVHALAIWTHVAGQRLEEAPSPLALVPALIHTHGAYYPTGGIGLIPQVLAEAAAATGVEFCHGTRVQSIRRDAGQVTGVETDTGEFLAADAVVANAAGLATYLQLLEGTPPARVRAHLQRLPLQSPGACAYLAVRGPLRPPYLHFHLPGGEELCRLLILPGVVVPELERDGWWPARLLAPLRHAWAENAGPAGQRAFLERLLAERWWREHVGEARVLATRIPAEWGAEYHLYRDSMNPVMTAQLMRAGRLAHRSPHVRGLYLAGSATHPGQWVSFCAISGILAADCLREDLA
jgi:phytoene dehydrogenase-like protein